MKNYLALVFLMSASLCLAQESYLYLNNNKYLSSEKMELRAESTYRSVYLRVALNNKSGLIELSFKESGSIQFLGGIQIFVDDGNFIKCNDYGYKDNISGYSYNIYKLTESELDYLCKHDITKIRYTTARFSQGSYFCCKYDYYATSDYSNNYGDRKEFIHVKSATIISNFISNQRNNNNSHDYNALFGVTSKKASSTKNNASKITVKPNHAEFGRKYGKRREPTSSGKINSMTVIFNKKSVIIYDAIETATFDIVGYEWMDGNLLWIDFSTKPQEFYMVIAFDSDGLVFVNNENDPQPGEEYKSLYFKELSRRDFKYVYK